MFRNSSRQENTQGSDNCTQTRCASKWSALCYDSANANMKTIYIVRHGESHINVSPTWIDDDSPDLTELGSEQARAIAERVSKLPIEVMITSTMRRTIATEEIIGDKMETCRRKIGKSLMNAVRPKV